MKKEKFSFRALTALVLFWSFIIEAVSGIILYIVPPGRIANWTNWKLLGFTKGGWESIHTIFGYLFLVFLLIHISYNWNALLTYIKKKINYGLKIRLEFFSSLLLAILIFIGTAVNIPPFISIMDFGEKMKNSWEDNRHQPFLSRAELLTFNQFIDILGIAEEEAIKTLKNKGVEVKNQNFLIKDIARSNKISPAKIYDILKNSFPSINEIKGKRSVISEPFGFRKREGQKTIEEIAKEVGISGDTAVKILGERGITAKRSDMLRKIAEKYNKTPSEIKRIIRENT